MTNEDDGRGQLAEEGPQLYEVWRIPFEFESDRGEGSQPSAPSTPPTVRFRSGRLPITLGCVSSVDIP